MNRKEIVPFFLMVLLFGGLSFGITSGCREYRINACEEDGGTAVVPPWFTTDPSAVSCIK